jgi:hypothetical protein
MGCIATSALIGARGLHHAGLTTWAGKSRKTTTPRNPETKYKKKASQHFHFTSTCHNPSLLEIMFLFYNPQPARIQQSARLDTLRGNSEKS